MDANAGEASTGSHRCQLRSRSLPQRLDRRFPGIEHIDLRSVQVRQAGLHLQQLALQRSDCAYELAVAARSYAGTEEGRDVQKSSEKN